MADQEREPDVANPWLQRKLYACTACGVQLLHDQMHDHVSFRCPDRPMPNKKPVLLVLIPISRTTPTERSGG